MANDAMLVTLDRIRFTWPRSKKMRVYTVGIAADNRGKILVTEPPSTAHVRHLPRKGRPSEWDFAGDGYPVYQRTGGLPDIIVAHLLIVRDRRGARKAGEIIRAVHSDKQARSAIGTASAALKKAGKGAAALDYSRRAAQAAKNLPRALKLRGDMLWDAGKRDAARRAYTEFLAAKPPYLDEVQAVKVRMGAQ